MSACVMWKSNTFCMLWLNVLIQIIDIGSGRRLLTKFLDYDLLIKVKLQNSLRRKLWLNDLNYIT